MTGYDITRNRMITSIAIISALALAALAFCGMAAAEQLYVNESGWWRDGGAFNESGAPIQAAVDAADAGGAIYVHGGNYYENVDVNKPRLTLVGAGTDVVSVTGADSDDHVLEVTANWTNLSGFVVMGATGSYKAGIYLDSDVNHCDISDNTASNNNYGIWLYRSSSNNTLTSNTASNNTNDGILLLSSSNNLLTDNTASSNNYGIRLYRSSNNTLTNNTANLNRGHDTWYGNQNGYGICLTSSSNNTLTKNTANLNNGCGISLWDSSNNTLQSSTANLNDFLGIQLSDSSNNMLTNNTVNSNDYHGIYLYSSSNNTLANNTASSNDYGIYIKGYSNDNNITCNWVQNNTQWGFYLIDPWFWYGGLTNNIISHNNIIENGNYNATTGGWEWQFYNDQPKDVDAKHNYWGAGMNNSTIDASIHKRGGKVEFYPFETEPVPCAPVSKKLPTFTTADAAIALQIAAGSRLLDFRYDVSGDGSVTSIDALMIVQAAAGVA